MNVSQDVVNRRGEGGWGGEGVGEGAGGEEGGGEGEGEGEGEGLVEVELFGHEEGERICQRIHQSRPDGL